ncbi:hypothetical protein CY34DRAFT_102051, partial [Suillus luteus UH-Slu-Lm8-n1]
VTADNASSNDTLVTELIDLVPHFTGEASRTQCFLHIVNLIVKSLLCEFDTLKKKGRERDEELDELTEDTELEDLQTQIEDPNKDIENDDGWVDEETLLDHEERFTPEWHH